MAQRKHRIAIPQNHAVVYAEAILPDQIETHVSKKQLLDFKDQHFIRLPFEVNKQKIYQYTTKQSLQNHAFKLNNRDFLKQQYNGKVCSYIFNKIPEHFLLKKSDLEDIISKDYQDEKTEYDTIDPDDPTTTIRIAYLTTLQEYVSFYTKIDTDHLHIYETEDYHRIDIYTGYGKVYQCACGNFKNLKACSACKRIYYCSTECQKNDWSTHKTRCPNMSKLDMCLNCGRAETHDYNQTADTTETNYSKSGVPTGKNIKFINSIICEDCHNITAID